jgi:hypothetical protein
MMMMMSTNMTSNTMAAALNGIIRADLHVQADTRHAINACMPCSAYQHHQLQCSMHAADAEQMHNTAKSQTHKCTVA